MIVVYVSPQAVAMAPGNPDSVTHAFAEEDKKATALLKKIKGKVDEFGVQKFIFCIFRKTHVLQI